MGTVRCRFRFGAHPRSERGAVLVHTTVAFTGLLAFSALTIDLGVMWVARTQAQNAADAGAHAAATTLAYVGPTATEAAEDAARAVIASNQVWGEPAGVGSASTVSFPACPPGPPTPGTCVQTYVHRDAAHGAPLPAYFANLLGLGAGDVWATATAQAAVGNSTTCLRPFAISDRWFDRPDNVWTPDDTFEPPLPPTSGTDEYVHPIASSAGSGYTVAGAVGTSVEFEMVNAYYATDPVPGNYAFFLDLPRAGSSGAVGRERFMENIASCNGQAVSVGQVVQTDPPPPDYFHAGDDATPELNALVDLDPGASWDPVSQAVQGSRFAVSPRVIAIAVFDPLEFHVAKVNGGGNSTQVQIRNIIGLFISDHVVNDRIRGVLMPLGGSFDQGAPQITDTAAFLRWVTLVR